MSDPVELYEQTMVMTSSGAEPPPPIPHQIPRCKVLYTYNFPADNINPVLGVGLRWCAEVENSPRKHDAYTKQYVV